jgi:hypothetical protein
MRSTARFLEGTLLGVALGVALGFLYFQKNAPRGVKDLWPLAGQSVTPQDPSQSPRFEGGLPEPAPWSAEPSEYEVAAAAVATESEVIVSPAVLEQPLTGAGWEPSAAPAQEAEVLEEADSPIPSEMEPYTSVEVEPLDAEGIPVWAEIPSPELEVEPDAEAAIEELQVADMAAEEAAAEQLQAERATAEESADEEAVEEVVLETAPVATPADDLKARIEETRRRIRRELEQPFIIGGGAAAAEASVTSGVEPAIGEALAVEPSPEEPPESQIQEPAASLVDESSLPAQAEVEERSSTEQVAGMQEAGVDYDAMRGRIEETRSRLKAKAFDAMMTGESALLGRDPDGVELKLPAPTEVDGEIVQTIDDTLREEES